MRLLGRHDVLPTGLSEVVASAVGFRNVLVHGYVDVDVDDRRVVSFLERFTRSEGVREPPLVLADRPDAVTPERSTVPAS